MQGPDDLVRALASIGRPRPDALYVYPDVVLFRQRQQIADFALKNRLPTVEVFREFGEAGGLMTYSAGVTDLFRRAAEQIDRIFKGAKPTELPVEQPTRFYLVINRASRES